MFTQKLFPVLYAADRWESSEEIKKYLKEGYMVVLDRYVSANQIHQGGKIANAKKRADFIKWLNELEYDVFKIPRPDITLYLSLPLPLVEDLIKERNKKSVRKYVEIKKMYTKLIWSSRRIPSRAQFGFQNF